MNKDYYTFKVIKKTDENIIFALLYDILIKCFRNVFLNIY